MPGKPYHTPRRAMIDVFWAILNQNWLDGEQETRNHHFRPLRPARISHHVTTDWTWGHAMRKKLLTASVVQQPAACTYKRKLEVKYMICYCIMKTYEEVEIQFHISLMLLPNGSKCTTSRCSLFSPGQNCSDIQINFIFFTQ
jgi:hypothetical protein